MNGVADQGSVTNASSAELDRWSACPHHSYDSKESIRFPVVLRGNQDMLVKCETLRRFRQAGGCYLGECIYLWPRAKQECPYEKVGNLDISAILANGKRLA